MKILVTGGAGYIGSVCVKALLDKNNEVLVIDNLSKGKRELVDERAEFHKVDLTDKEKVFEICKGKEIDAVMHFASYKAAGESMKDAVKYSDNLTGTVNLLNAMVKFNIKKLVFSSSAAVYGISDKKIINESCELKPINFYGFIKLECERIIEWYHKIYGINYISLRYFNVAGDGGLKYLDPHAENVFPILMEVLTGERDKFIIFGNDYDTKDGTAVRDYIDVNDLVHAHVLALSTNYNGVINLGSGEGQSVKELVNAFKEVTGKNLVWEYGARREGDPHSLIASNSLAKEILGWNPKKGIKEMIKTTYLAYGE